MFKLYPSTVRTGQICLNMVVRTAIIALAWAIFLVIGFALNWLIDQILGLTGASASIKAVAREIVIASVIVLAVIATWTSLSDMVALAYTLTKSAIKDLSEGKTRKPDD